MALQKENWIYLEKWFEYYNMSFGDIMGRFVLWSKEFTMKMGLNLNIFACLKEILAVVSDCFHVSGSLRSSFSKIFTMCN